MRCYYSPPFKSKDNDYQPEILQHDLVEHNHVLGNNYPTKIPMMSSNEKLKCRKVPYVIIMFQINTQNLKSMPITFCLCVIHIEMEIT